VFSFSFLGGGGGPAAGHDLAASDFHAVHTVLKDLGSRLHVMEEEIYEQCGHKLRIEMN